MELVMDFARMRALDKQRETQPRDGTFRTTCGRCAVWRTAPAQDETGTPYCSTFTAELYRTMVEARERLSTLRDCDSVDAVAKTRVLGIANGHIFKRTRIGSQFPVVMDELSQETAVMCDELFSNNGDVLPSLRKSTLVQWGQSLSPDEGDPMLILDDAELQVSMRGQGLAASLWRDMCHHLATGDEPVFRVVVCAAGFLNFPKLDPKPTDLLVSQKKGNLQIFARKTLRPCGFRCLKFDCYYACVAHDLDHPCWDQNAADPTAAARTKRGREIQAADPGPNAPPRPSELAPGVTGAMFREIIAPGRPCSCGQCAGVLPRNTMDALLFTSEFGCDSMRDHAPMIHRYAPHQPGMKRNKGYVQGVGAILEAISACVRRGDAPTLLEVETEVVARHYGTVQPFLQHGGTIGGVIAYTCRCSEEEHGPGGMAEDMLYDDLEKQAKIDEQACDRDYEWSTLPTTLLGNDAYRFLSSGAPFSSSSDDEDNDNDAYRFLPSGAPRTFSSSDDDDDSDLDGLSDSDFDDEDEDDDDDDSMY